MEIKFTPVRPIAAEGARIGVVTCLECGATVTLDPDDEKDALGLHREFHKKLKGKG